MSSFHIQGWQELMQVGYRHCDTQEGCYVGQLDQSGRRHGEGYFLGRLTKDFYIGDWHQDLMHGRGKLLYNFKGSYETYEGQWMIGERHGLGEYKIFDEVLKQQVTVYRGNFSYGVYQGLGRLELDSTAYEGSFQNGCPHKTGKFFSRDTELAEVTFDHAFLLKTKPTERRKSKLRTVLITDAPSLRLQPSVGSLPLEEF